MTDPAKLAAWFEAHAAVLVLYARQWLDRGRAEDIVQEAFVRLMGQSIEPTNVRAWLHSTVRNAAIDEARAAARRRSRENRKAIETPEWFETQPTDVLDADRVQRAVAKLPPRQREIVMLRIWSGMTLTEIAQVTQLAISTVHGDYRRGLDAIRQTMESPCRTTND
jgi:RNA polymerase sigma factor (sigma-70 family)